MLMKELLKMSLNERMFDRRKDVRMSSQFATKIERLLNDDSTMNELLKMIHDDKISKDFIIQIITKRLSRKPGKAE